jgi:hypothetical protein
MNKVMTGTDRDGRHGGETVRRERASAYFVTRARMKTHRLKQAEGIDCATLQVADLHEVGQD